jgi:trk system potassium uptake protein TrkA
MYRKGEAIVPHGDTIVHSEDTLAIAAADDGREALFNIIGQKKVAPKKIVIVGGSKIARFLLKSFKSSELRNIALVEQNPQVCDSFASLFPNLLVIRSDITDETIFEEELLNRYDLLISLTDSDELNIITASYAKSEGVGSTIALIKRNNNYSRLARHLNIDSIISVSEATVDSLLKYMRGKHVSSVHSLFNGLFEVFESEVSKEMKICGKKIEQLNIQKKAIICGITKSDKTNIIPTGSYKIESGDILLVCAERSQLTTVQKVFLQ